MKDKYYGPGHWGMEEYDNIIRRAENDRKKKRMAEAEEYTKDKEIERLKKELESALVDSCKYIDCSYREALKEGI